LDGPAIAAAIAARQADIVSAFGNLAEDEWRGPSHLPDWSRLTVLCHIRYGAEAINRLITAALAGEPALFYPGGRLEQRPATLLPAEGEEPHNVLESFAHNSAALDATLGRLTEADWSVESREPAGIVDLGPQTVEQLAILRLTEVDVHAVDLDVGITHWTDTFVRVGLPLRFDRLATRLANQRPINTEHAGTWLLRTIEGEGWTVTIDGNRSHVQRADYDSRADASITASARDLLALLLGRPLETEAVYAGDIAFAAAFTQAFPGP
jgi:maleylpyruvate isomerase